MILVITEDSDQTTHKVLEYILGNQKDFQRINDNDLSIIYFSFNTSEKNFKIVINNREITKTDKIWIRRGRFSFFEETIKNQDKRIAQYLLKEENALNKSLEIALKQDYHIVGSYLKEVENYKVTNLLIAKQVGLSIPETLITSLKSEALCFYKEQGNIISKDLRYAPNVDYGEYILNSVGTIEVTEKDFINMADKFFPTLFQRKIDKEVEIRTFVFQKKIYSMAIFSQDDEKTKLDYRNFNPQNPNRLVPFQLPAVIEQKVLKFMEVSDMDSGSIDFILDKNGIFIFLEINPQGQIDWLSEYCNYYIEKEIAEHLVEHI